MKIGHASKQGSGLIREEKTWLTSNRETHKDENYDERWDKTSYGFEMRTG